jgi:NAD(P)-dependent dehydrogenase (short-subunit alcohol dehydrogenase family)
MTNLVGKSAVVAAGAKNLGGLISTTLAEKGVNVAVHYNSPATEPDADNTVAAVQDAGVKAITVQGDLTKPGNVSTLFDATVDAFGGVDIAINTVGKVLRSRSSTPARLSMTRCSTSTPRPRTSSCSRRGSG